MSTSSTTTETLAQTLTSDEVTETEAKEVQMETKQVKQSGRIPKSSKKQQQQVNNEALQRSLEMVVAHEKARLEQELEEEEEEEVAADETESQKSGKGSGKREEKKEDVDNEVDAVFQEEEEEEDVSHLLGENDIAEMLQEMCKGEKYKFKETQIRNVLLVGRSRSGKTTVVNTLKTVENTTAKLSMFAGTANVNFRSFSLSEPGMPDYTINIIDTPGLFEIVKSDQVARTDEEITKMIADCLRHEITKIHVIVMTCSIEAGISLIDVQAMQKMIKYFGNDVNMALCITRAEATRAEERKRFKGELKKHKDFGELITLVRDHVCFMGAIDPLRISSKEMLKAYYEQISKDRRLLLQFIFACKKETKIEELKFVAEQQAEIEAKLYRLTHVAEDMMKKTEIDGEFERVYKRLKKSTQNQKTMISIYNAKCLAAFQKLSEASAELDKHYNKLKKA